MYSDSKRAIESALRDIFFAIESALRDNLLGTRTPTSAGPRGAAFQASHDRRHIQNLLSCIITHGFAAFMQGNSCLNKPNKEISPVLALRFCV